MRNNNKKTSYETFGSLTGFTHILVHLLLPLLSERDIFYLSLSCLYFWRNIPEEKRKNYTKSKIPSLLSFNEPLLKAISSRYSAPSLVSNQRPVLRKALKATSAPTFGSAKTEINPVKLCGIVFSTDPEYYTNLFKRSLEKEASQTQQRIETKVYESDYQFKKISLKLFLLSCELDYVHSEIFFQNARLIYIVIDPSNRDFFMKLPNLLSRIRSYFHEIPPIWTLIIKDAEIQNENMISAEEIIDFFNKGKMTFRYWLNPANESSNFVLYTLRACLQHTYPDVRAEDELVKHNRCNIC